MNRKLLFGLGLMATLWLALAVTAHAWYDPTTRAFLSRDPIREAGGINLYAYCENDPIGNFDPIGLATDGPLDQLDERIGQIELRLRKAGRKGQKTLDIANRRLDHFNREVARIEGKLDAGLDAQWAGTPGEALQQIAIGAFDPVRSLFAAQTIDRQPFWQQVMGGEWSLAAGDPMSNPRLFGSVAGSELMGYGAVSLASGIRPSAVRFSGTDLLAQARARLNAVQAQYGYLEVPGMLVPRVGSDVNIALGLGRAAGLEDGLVFRFAKQVDALHYFQWEDAGLGVWKNNSFESYFGQAAQKATRIHFNLTGIDLEESLSMPVNFSLQGNITNSELNTILNTPSLLDKTIFYQDEVIVPAPK